jgi:hypothetical protein
MRRRLAFVPVVGVLTVLLSGCFGLRPPSPPPPKPPVLDAACKGTLVVSTPGSVVSNAVTEMSGIAASRSASGVWWLHNDSGDSARVFAIGDDGRDLGEFAFGGASATDWEDIAAGPGPSLGVNYLYAADIGDNARTRTSVRVYRVPEPAVDPAVAPSAPQTLTDVASLTFTYPDAPHDAESLLVDPVSRKLFIVTKEFSGVSKVFRAPADLPSGSTTTLVQVATISLGSGLGALATAADVSPDGDVVGLRTYSKVLLFPRVAGSALEQAFSKAPCAGKIATEPQGEAFGFTRDGRGYTTASEGAHPPLHRFLAP